jgi:thymidine phosphorylase
VEYLTGERRQDRIHAVVLELGAEMLVLGGLAQDVPAGRRALQHALDSGAAAERFERMVRALSGPSDLLARPWEHLERAPVVVDVPVSRSQYVGGVDARAVGLAVVALGGGRTRPPDPVDHAVGLTDLAAIGDEVGPERPLARVHARSTDAAERAAARWWLPTSSKRPAGTTTPSSAAVSPEHRCRSPTDDRTHRGSDRPTSATRALPTARW